MLLISGLFFSTTRARGHSRTPQIGHLPGVTIGRSESTFPYGDSVIASMATGGGPDSPGGASVDDPGPDPASPSTGLPCLPADHLNLHDPANLYSTRLTRFQSVMAIWNLPIRSVRLRFSFT